VARRAFEQSEPDATFQLLDQHAQPGWRDEERVGIVQNPTTSLAGDVAATKRVIAEQKRPVILVGHSYGKRGLVVMMTNSRNEEAPELGAALALLRTRHIVITGRSSGRDRSRRAKRFGAAWRRAIGFESCSGSIGRSRLFVHRRNASGKRVSMLPRRPRTATMIVRTADAC
jgi:pimeloyl-ACP methyl ester carboxylesterase